MIRAINNRLDHNFSFVERRFQSVNFFFSFRFVYMFLFSSQPKFYRSISDFKPIKIDSINGTLTFQWFPSKPGYFPSDYRNIIYATITNFGTTNKKNFFIFC